MTAPMTPREKELVECLYHLHFKKLYFYANSLLEDPERARDVVQDTFHEALRHIDTLARHENQAGWLMNTLKNKIRESERARRRYLRRFFSLDTDFPDRDALPDERAGAPPELPEEDPLDKIEKTLTPEEFYLLRRMIFEGASHLQVAQELDISVYASQKRLERIRDKLSAVFPGRRRKKL